MESEEWRVESEELFDRQVKISAQSVTVAAGTPPKAQVCYAACMQTLNTIINCLVVLLVGLILWIVADIRNDIRHLHTRIDNVLLSRSAEVRD